MTDIADSGNLAVYVNLIAARIRVDGDAVIGSWAYACLQFPCFSECEFMWPDYIVWASIGLAFPCIDDVHLVNLLVAVPVVRSQVDGVLDGFNSRDYHLSRVFVVAVRVIRTIV